MLRHRGLMVALGSAVFAAGALAAPVAAVNPRLALVNGISGRTVDVCIGTSEVRSSLKYGGWVERFVAPGSRTIRFRAASPGRCKGTVLAQTTLLLNADDDKTIVGTRRAPKVVVFDNLPYPPPANASIRFRNAGDLGPVNLVNVTHPFTAPAAAPPSISKGQQAPASNFTSPVGQEITLFLAGRARPFHRDRYSTDTEQRHEVILVGTSPRNDKTVSVRRPIPGP